MTSSNDTSTPFGTRTLAAIMFTDVVGFSLLMGEQENLTLTAVHRDFDLMSACIVKSSGKVLKTLGDGILAYFSSAVNAVACAQDIQCAIANAAATRTKGLSLKHRIGIHLGDVFVTPSDVLGNGVNIAARLQGRAEPGGICISQTVFDVVKNKLTLQVNYLGAQELKHIRESIPIYLVTPRQTSTTGTARVTIGAPPASQRPMSGSLNFSRVSGAGTPLHAKTPARAPSRREAGQTYTIAIVGDFSGRGGRGLIEPLTERRPLAVDIDNFDAVFSLLKVRAGLPAYHRFGGITEIALEHIDHFHPDELLRRVGPLAELWSLRAALDKPASAAAAIARLQALLPLPAAASLGTDSPQAAENNAATLARLFKRPAGTPVATADSGQPARTVDALLRPLLHSVSSTATASDNLNIAAMRQALDLELTDQLRAILHHPDLQTLESLWRGLQLLVREFGGEPQIKLLVIDASKSELIDQAQAFDGVLKRAAPSFVVADLMVGAELDDVTLLTQLAQAAVANGARLLAGARPELVGCESFARAPDPDEWNIAPEPEVSAAWNELRRSPLAGHVTLAAPRFLLRQPYGKRSDPIESFAFEELSPSLPHECFLWGNPAFACAHLLATEIVQDRDPYGKFSGEIPGLPLFSYSEEGQTTVKPCAEAWLTDRAARTLETRGVTAMLSVKNSDALRVNRLASTR